MTILWYGFRYFKQSLKKYIRLLKYFSYYHSIKTLDFKDTMPSAKVIGLEMKKLAQIFENDPLYFDCFQYEHKYMVPYVAKVFDFIKTNIPKEAKILDICGGPGNLGLALCFHGFTEYLLADIDDIRMRWGRLLWKKCGKELKWQKENALQMSFQDEEFDVVTLLGWENSQTPYSYALKECVRVLKPGGVFICTYHNTDEIVEGNWDFDPSRTYSYLPYSISHNAIHMLCQYLGLSILEETRSGHPSKIKEFFPDEKKRFFPQYILFCKKTS